MTEPRSRRSDRSPVHLAPRIGEGDNPNLADRPVPLPVRVRPRPGEAVDVYVRRLALANHLKPSYLRGYLAGPPDYGRGKRPRADRLAAVSGRQQAVLERALVDLVRQKPTKPDRPKRRITRAEDKPALFAAIRRDAQAEQLPISHLARRHRVGHTMVRQALSSPTPPPRKKPPPAVGSAKGRIGPMIDTILEEHLAQNGGRTPTVALVWERLLDEHGSSVAYATVHRYLSTHPLWSPDTLARQPTQSGGNFLASTQQTFHTNVIKHYRALLTAPQSVGTRHGTASTVPMPAPPRSCSGWMQEAPGACSPGSRNGLWSALIEDMT
jgi:hypothetical protein